LIELDDQPCILAITEDITQAEQLERQFRQAQRMEAIGRLAGGIAHDFNNILGVILGYSELLQNRLASDQVAVCQLAEIKSASERASALNRQLLAFSRQQLLQPRLLNLNDVIAGVGSMLRRVVREDIELILIPGEDLGAVNADPTQVEQIVMNLVVNARDAMPKGGMLTIRTANKYLDEDYARKHPGVRSGPSVLLAINDTGTGITPDVLPHIFEPFFTTKPAGEGTGLGLATVYGIVKQSDGYIWVDTEPGVGTTFEIYFPRIETTASNEKPQQEAQSTSAGSETILLVEDDKAFRKLTRKILEHAGYSVLEAPDPVAARDVIGALRSNIDLLLTDVVMPKGNGRQLAEELRQVQPGIKVLFMSGHTGELLKNSREHANAKLVVISKPFSRGSLLAAVRRVLGM
jgi:nitrogen-specific signal transduction histidine kinase/CheY-like chemotaxis protein